MAAFQIYKPGQGRYARITMGVMLALLAAYGCTALRDALAGSNAGEIGWLSAALHFQVTYVQVVPVGVFVALAGGVVWALNYPKFAEFLIETEIEMQRVAWPSRSSVVGSSIVVILTVLLMSFILWGMDTVLVFLMQKTGLY